MTDHDHDDDQHTEEPEEVTYLLDKLDAIRLSWFDEPVTDHDPADPAAAAALVSAVEMANGDPAACHLVWRTINTAVLGPTGEPVGVATTRYLAFPMRRAPRRSPRKP